LGCFNLSVYTTEKDLRELFGEFGEIEKASCVSRLTTYLKVELVYDHPTGRSRGFGFVYFERLEDACAARDKLSGQEIDGHKIRVDYSLTKRAHTPTPGQYMGAIRGSRRNYGYGSGGYSGRSAGNSLRCFSRRTPSPPRRERHRSRSYD
uniref:RRM domain-containing protein n=1 Tax=Haemonchus placei TaxID=6290 RepID=A0A0N4WAG6_HAEPC